MQFKDAKLPSDWIEAKLRLETHGNLIEVEMQGVEAECIYLTKEDADSLGRHLIALAEQI